MPDATGYPKIVRPHITAHDRTLCILCGRVSFRHTPHAHAHTPIGCAYVRVCGYPAQMQNKVKGGRDGKEGHGGGNSMSDNELDHFKNNISLVDYVSSAGFALDRAKSSTRVKVYRRDHDKLLVWVGLEDGHDVFRNERTLQGGSVLDFVMMEEGCSLGRARLTLRRFLGTTPSSPPRPSGKPPTAVSVQDEGYRKKTAAVWKAARWEPEPVYLLGRGLSRLTMTLPCFVDTFRQDKKGNVVFPHHDREGMCGYELRSATLKTFGAGTKKGLWHSNNCVSSLSIVICESSIDCLSHFQLHGGDAGYVSLGGAIGSRQRDLLTGLFVKAQRRSARVIVATDNDAPGEQYFEQLQLLSPFALERQTPCGKDWNDDLNRA